MKHFLKDFEYDLYSFTLDDIPFFYTGKSIKQKCYSVLERLHPCFTEQSVFDIVYSRKNAKKGSVTVTAVVIDSLILADYRNCQNAQSLYIHKLKGKRLFVSERQLLLERVICFLLPCLILFLGMFLFIRAVSITADVEEPSVVLQETDSKRYTYKTFLDEALPKFLEQSSFDPVFLSYSTASSVPELTLQQNGLYQEQIEQYLYTGSGVPEMAFTSTTFKDGIPNLTVIMKFDSEQEKTISFSDREAVIIALRSAVSESKGLPVSENGGTGDMQCIIPYSGFQTFLLNLSEICREQTATFSKFILDYSRDSGSINCILTVDRLKTENPVDYTVLGSFFQKPIIKKPAVTDTKQETTAPSAKATRTLIGKMPSVDGSYIYYYRTEEGKIEYERE